MDKSQLIREFILSRCRQHGETVEQAQQAAIVGLDLDPTMVQAVVDALMAEAEENRILDGPRGVSLKHAKDEVSYAPWYVGPQAGDRFWPKLRTKLSEGSMASVVDETDLASTKVVAHLANPSIHSSSKKGLVVGYVQSGKTANYTAVMAKAADAGYRFVIVLSGLHNNLRKQTQQRINDDLQVGHDWFPLTTDDHDFGTVSAGAALMASKIHIVAVVKKNPSRLRRLRDWLEDIPENVRSRCPILLIDDEADQATPNTQAARNDISAINALVREVWQRIPTGSYVGYTATPFANVFMDPNDETDMYPEDFIIDLPRPAAYFGAERIFGLGDPLDPESETGLDMVRTVASDQAASLVAPTAAVARALWNAPLPESLVDACLWFVIATAARRSRSGKSQHSSMLVHTSAYVIPHFKMQEVLADLVDGLLADVNAGRFDRFEGLFEAEIGRVKPESGNSAIKWAETRDQIAGVLAEIRVIVDNGISTDRVDYGRKDALGKDLIETVIAIGGGTLSRGLTLEGLIVSYFTRTATTYDTLLQMGRWFGYRVGYEELPRIWVTDEVREYFQFLARVELEIREEMQQMESMEISPRQMGLRVRAHPGRLAITAKSKMHFADKVQVSFSGQHHQTIVFDETNSAVQQRNIDAATALLQFCTKSGSESTVVGNSRVFSDIDPAIIRTFLSEYQFHADQLTLRPKHILGWIDKIAHDAPWNVAVVSRSTAKFGTLDIGLPSPIHAISRAPLSSSSVGTANIKGLVTAGDQVLDLGEDAVERVKNKIETYRAARAALADGKGLLTIYPISEDSTPTPASVLAKSRRGLKSELPLIGLGITFPETLETDSKEDGTFVAVTPDWVAGFDEEEYEAIPADDELDANIDGNAALKGLMT